MKKALPAPRLARALCLLAMALALLVWGGFARAQENATPLEQALHLQRVFMGVYERVRPASVTVFPETRELGLAEKIKRGMERRSQGLGSGFIVHKDGYVITNEHVVREGQKLSVLLSDGRKYEGKLVGKDQLLDIALVKIVVPEEEKGTVFPTVRLGDSDVVRPGMRTIAIGNPVGTYFDDSEPVISVGIVSGLNRTFVSTLQDRRKGLRTYGGLIQTDAALNPGNSGGPLLNIRGEVIGVNTVIWSPTGFCIGLGFAVPINTVKRKVPLLEKGCGVTKPMPYGTIDAKIERLNEVYADVLHLKGERGVYVKAVLPGGAAAAAGMRDKDVIFRVNGQRVVNEAQFVSLVAHCPIGEAVPFEVARVVEDQPKRLIINVALSGKTLEEIQGGSSPREGKRRKHEQ